MKIKGLGFINKNDLIIKCRVSVKTNHIHKYEGITTSLTSKLSILSFIFVFQSRSRF